MVPPMYPTAAAVTPWILRNAASTPQKQPAPNVACAMESSFAESIKTLEIIGATSVQCSVDYGFRFIVSICGCEVMPSPFPGMDPYLEDAKLWPVFHHHFVTCLYQILLPGLIDRYRARIAQRQYITEQALF